MADLKKLGKYNILSILGQGAMGIVYKGFDPHIERTVALKTIRKEALNAKEMEPLLARFKREAQAAGRLTHPGIVTVYEYGEAEDTAYIAMEFVDGREIKDFLDKNERFPLNTIVAIISQLLDALAYSHGQGVIHRDIKPGNILLLDNGRIKVTDFGIARIESSTLTQFGDVIGTPSYMSPEQFSGQQVDNRSDLFSTGVILYHLLTGEKPFPGNSLTTIMHRVINSDPPLMSDLNFQIPSYLDAVVLKALAKKPANRFLTADEFKAALTNLAPAGSNMPTAEDSGDATVMIGSSDPTVNISAAEIAVATRLGGTASNQFDLQTKFDKIVDMLESQGGGAKAADRKLYNTARTWVLTILVTIILAIFGYTVWAIYTKDLTYVELEQIVREQVEDLPGLLTSQEKPVVEITQTAKTRPAKEFTDGPARKEEGAAPAGPPPANASDQQETARPEESGTGDLSAAKAVIVPPSAATDP
jgi:tRNA A-37 threonylcarbamoyl transferase component Bud32